MTDAMDEAQIMAATVQAKLGAIAQGWNEAQILASFASGLAVEVAATETLAEAGMVPQEAAEAIRKRADFSVERIHAIEAEVRHDVIAFTTAVAGSPSHGCANWPNPTARNAELTIPIFGA